MSEEIKDLVTTSPKSKSDKRLELSAVNQSSLLDQNIFTFPTESLSFSSQFERSLESSKTMSQSMSQTFWKSSDIQLQQQQQHFRRFTETKKSTTFSRSISLSSSSAVNSNSFSSASTLAMRRGKRALVLQPLGEIRRRLLPGISYE